MRDPAKNRPKLVPTDMEQHGGWDQSIATEKRNIVESIDNCIKHGYTHDPERAKQILQLELDNQHEEKGVPKSQLALYQKSPSKSPINNSPDTVPYDMVLDRLRDTNGFLVIEEKKMGFTKKKRFDLADARALQTRINLKFPEMINNSKRKIEDLALYRKSGFIDPNSKNY